MASLRGERFHINLDDDNDGDTQVSDPPPPDNFPPPLNGFVKEIQERTLSANIPPAPPTAKQTSSGFPLHKKRVGTSRFKAERNRSTPHDTQPPPVVAQDVQDGLESRTRREIDEENTARLAQMSDADIAKERRELLSELDPSFLERLLKKANIDDSAHDTGEWHGTSSWPGHDTRQDEPSKIKKNIAFDGGDGDGYGDGDGSDNRSAQHDLPHQDSVDTPPSPTTTATTTLPDPPSIHFPQAPSVPALDPSSPTFLTDLHSKYFASLPTDPSKLAWMSDASIPSSALASNTNPQDKPDLNNNSNNEDDTYSPTALDLPASSLRFSFSGALLPPKLAAALPVTLGLHHHGAAPSAAGYTIPELAHLAQSSFPAQRCIAYQTLGRILYRLGKGEFGDVRSDLGGGLWGCVRDGKVVQILEAEVGGGSDGHGNGNGNRTSGRGTHRSAEVFAVEALWLWRKGGGMEIPAE